MAVVRFYRTSPVPGNTTPAVGWLEFTPTGRRVIAGDPDNTVLPMKFSVQLEAGRVDVDLAATSASWAWQIREHIVGLPPRVWTAAVPSGSVTVDDTDLVVVSPGTLVPVEVNDPAFTVEATTLAAGASATAAITGSYPALKLNLGIPQGPAGAGSPPATAGAFGSVKLAGDLGGAADAPTVPGLTGKQDKSTLDADVQAKVNDAASATRTTLNAAFASAPGVKYGTKRATWATAAPGDQSSTSLQAAMARYLVKTNVKTSRWRVKVRNYNCRDNITGPSHTATKIYVGKHTIGALGTQTGNFAGGTASTPVTGGFTIPGDGTFYTSPWITDPTLQFDPMTEYVVGIGLNNASATSIFRGATQGYYSTSDAPGSSGTVISGVLFDFQIEYEYTGDQRLGLFIGDSITAGNGGDNAKYAPPFLTWPAHVAARQAGTHVNAGVGGSKSGDWAGATTGGYWDRFDWANLKPDYVIVSLGRNDITASVSLATFQANMDTIVQKLRTTFGTGIPIYLGTVAPRNDTVAGVLSTAAASGATTLTSTKSLTGGVTLDPDRSASTEAVTVSSVSGTGPYTLTLSAATTKAHGANAKVVSSSNESVRWQYNMWLRTCPLGAQGVMDFDRALVDPADPALSVMLPEYVFADNLHLSLAGMARAGGVPSGRLG